MQPLRARETLEDLVQRGVKSDLITWNTLLSAYAKAHNVDGAYEVWQNMQRSGIVPDRFTQVTGAVLLLPCRPLWREMVEAQEMPFPPNARCKRDVSAPLEVLMGSSCIAACSVASFWWECGPGS